MIYGKAGHGCVLAIYNWCGTAVDILCAGHVMLGIFLLVGTKVGNEIIVGLCRLFSAVCNPRAVLIVQV